MIVFKFTTKGCCISSSARFVIVLRGSNTEMNRNVPRNYQLQLENFKKKGLQKILGTYEDVNGFVRSQYLYFTFHLMATNFFSKFSYSSA